MPLIWNPYETHSNTIKENLRKTWAQTSDPLKEHISAPTRNLSEIPWNLKCQMNRAFLAIYHILLCSQYGIRVIHRLKGHVVLKKRFISPRLLCFSRPEVAKRACSLRRRRQLRAAGHHHIQRILEHHVDMRCA